MAAGLSRNRTRRTCLRQDRDFQGPGKPHPRASTPAIHLSGGGVVRTRDRLFLALVSIECGRGVPQDSLIDERSAKDPNRIVQSMPDHRVGVLTGSLLGSELVHPADHFFRGRANRAGSMQEAPAAVVRDMRQGISMFRPAESAMLLGARCATLRSSLKMTTDADLLGMMILSSECLGGTRHSWWNIATDCVLVLSNCNCPTDVGLQGGAHGRVQTQVVCWALESCRYSDVDRGPSAVNYSSPRRRSRGFRGSEPQERARCRQHAVADGHR